MQVFFDEQVFQFQRVGGISRYVVELAAALARSGHLRVVVFGGWTPNEHLRHLAPVEGLEIVYVPRPARWRVNKLSAQLSLRWRRGLFNRVAARDPRTIYHPTFFADDPVVRARAAATVVTFYDMIPELFADHSPHARRNLAQRAFIAPAADALLAISESTARDLEKFYPTAANRLYVTPLAAQPLNTASDPVKPARPYFLMVGSRRAYKNGLLGLRAFAQLSAELNAPTLLLAGGEDLSEEERRILAQPLSQNRVNEVILSDSELAAAYHGALALVYPSRYEGFGLPVLEAMQSGCPVVTTRCSSLAEVAGEAALYVDPDDEPTLVAHLRELATNPARRAQLAEWGRAQAARFSWARTAELTLAAYRHALDSRRAKPPPAT